MLIVYEDYATAVRAKRALDLLPDPATADAGLSTRLWRLGLLSQPLFEEQAAIEAAASDVLVFSVHGRRPLPVRALGWMRRWLVHRERRPYALCVLLDTEAAGRGANHPVVRSVRRIADAAGADMFFGFYAAREDEPVTSSRDPGDSRRVPVRARCRSTQDTPRSCCSLGGAESPML